MNPRRRVKQSWSVTKCLIRDPKQTRHLMRLAKTVGRNPIEVRLPWLAFDVIDWLDDVLTPTSVVLEYGGGGSTAFFADRVAEVDSIEHDFNWASALEAEFAGNERVTVHYVPPANEYSEYVAMVSAWAPESVDLVLIDGRERIACLQRSMAVLKPGGFMVLDDTERARYRSAHEILAGWEKREFRGLSPYKEIFGFTTVWRKPGGQSSS